jgi:prepilin-type N-terminal cleavage/methylation domain-containing protein
LINLSKNMKMNYWKKKMKSNFGFTLLELLVVIAVIGTLAGIVLIRLTGGETGARDAKRQSDLKQYQAAIEIYANNHGGSYPPTGSGRAIDLCGPGKPLGDVPCADDPLGTPDYGYQSGASNTQYVLWARLEKPKTVTWFVVCSTGESGNVTSGVPPSGGNCPNI